MATRGRKFVRGRLKKFKEKSLDSNIKKTNLTTIFIHVRNIREKNLGSFEPLMLFSTTNKKKNTIWSALRTSGRV